MRLQTLESCAMCLRAIRDWQTVTLNVGGVPVFSAKCCRGCACDVETTVARLVRETRASAVMGQPR